MTEAKVKKYYSNLPFTTIHVMRGAAHCEAVQFVAGVLETADPEVQKHCDAIVDKPGSGIVSTSRDDVDASVIAAQQEVRAAGEKAHAKMVAAGLATA